MTRAFRPTAPAFAADVTMSAVVDRGRKTSRVKLATSRAKRVPAPKLAPREYRHVNYAVIAVSVYVDDLAVMDRGVDLLRDARKRHTSRSEFLRRASAHYVAFLEHGGDSGGDGNKVPA